MTASRILITWLSRKSRRTARYSPGLPATRNIDLSNAPTDGSGGSVWHLRSLSKRIHLRQPAIIALVRPCSH